MKTNRRVAITGIGIISPLGNNREDTWKNLMQQCSGIAPIRQFDASHFPTQIAAEVKNFSLSSSLKTRQNRYLGPFTSFALQAAAEAFDDAGILPLNTEAERWGIVTGSGMMTAEFDYLHRFQEACAPEGTVDWTAVTKK